MRLFDILKSSLRVATRSTGSTNRNWFPVAKNLWSPPYSPLDLVGALGNFEAGLDHKDPDPGDATEDYVLGEEIDNLTKVEVTEEEERHGGEESC